MPRCAATAATWRVWLDCTPPIETSVSAPFASASGTRYSSLRVLLPPKARPLFTSSRFIQTRAPPRWSLRRSTGWIGLGPNVSGWRGKSASAMVLLLRWGGDGCRYAGACASAVGSSSSRFRRRPRVDQFSRAAAPASSARPASQSSMRRSWSATEPRPASEPNRRVRAGAASGVTCSSSARHGAGCPLARTGDRVEVVVGGHVRRRRRPRRAPRAKRAFAARIASRSAVGEQRHGVAHGELVHRRGDGLRVAGGAGVERC